MLESPTSSRFLNMKDRRLVSKCHRTLGTFPFTRREEEQVIPTYRIQTIRRELSKNSINIPRFVSSQTVIHLKAHELFILVKYNIFILPCMEFEVHSLSSSRPYVADNSVRLAKSKENSPYRIHDQQTQSEFLRLLDIQHRKYFFIKTLKCEYNKNTVKHNIY